MVVTRSKPITSPCPCSFRISLVASNPSHLMLNQAARVHTGARMRVRAYATANTQTIQKPNIAKVLPRHMLHIMIRK
jgi:hypothetical protein